MNNRTHPTEDHLIEQLAAFQPAPSAGYQRRMAQQPWHTAHSPRWRSVANTGLLTLVLLIGLTLAIPTWRVAAARWIGLTKAGSDTISANIALNDTPAPPLSVAAAEAQAGFAVREPNYLPADFTFVEATVLTPTNVVWLRYERPATEGSLAVDTIAVRQMTVASYEGLDAVLPGTGASAPIEPVDLDGVQGEYVEGAWVSDAPAVPGEPVQLRWNPAAAMKRIDWRNGDMLYHVDATGESISKEELMRVAASLR